MTATLNQQIFRQYDVRGIVGRDLTPTLRGRSAAATRR
jgi:phosphomannomutase